jgi:hypothetical protein
MSAATVARSVRSLRRVRRDADAIVRAYPGVIGSMIGLKVQDAVIRNRLGLTVFVRRKIPDGDLARSQRIPRTIRIARTEVVVDVLAIGPLYRQSGAFPVDASLLVHDGVETGTMSCLCRSRFGIFGLTCAHVVEGPDHDPATPARIEIWSPVEARYEPVGQSSISVTGPGTGSPGEYGFADAAIFTVEHPELVERARTATPIAASIPPVGTLLFGRDVVGGRRTGRILGVDQQIDGIFVDLAIIVDPPGTFPGDSGMLWRNQAGQPVAIHAYGERAGPGQGSRLTAAMFAVRAEQRLAVQLLNL